MEESTEPQKPGEHALASMTRAVSTVRWYDGLRVRRVTVLFLAAVGVVAADVAYQRIGTTANVDVVQFFRNLSGGFLAVGMTETQPGFLVLSALDRDKVDVAAEQSAGAASGVHTTIHVRTPATEWRRRLRGPVVVTVLLDGSTEVLPVDWSVDQFRALRDAVDCIHGKASGVRRCGRPFAEMGDLLATWPLGSVPG